MNSSMKRTDPAEMEKLRAKALNHADKEAEKERFGLFTQASPLGLGDCRYEAGHHPRDEDGNVKMQPANFYTSPMKLTKSPEVYFDNANFTNPDKFVDPYIDYTKIHRPLKHKPIPQKKNSDNEWIKPEPFLPAVTKFNEYKRIDDHAMIYKGNPYKNMPDYPIKKIVKRVDADDKVIIGPSNVITEPVRHGHYNSTYGHTINKYPDYSMGQGYDNERHKDFEADKKWQAKYKETQFFKSMSYGPCDLNRDMDLYGDRPKLGPEKKVWKYKQALSHLNPFTPSNPHKSGKLGTFDDFKRLIPDPKAIHKATRRPEVENRKDSFFPSRGGLSKPCPSIS